MLCVQMPTQPDTPVGTLHECMPSDVQEFVENVHSELADGAAELSGSIARCNGIHFVGNKYKRVIDSSLQSLRRICTSTANRMVWDSEVLFMCIYCLYTSKCRVFNMESMFNTDKMSPHEPLGHQNKVAWLMLKAAFSIDYIHARHVVELMTTLMPEILGVCGIFSLLIQTDFGVHLFKFSHNEKSMPIASAVFSSKAMISVLTKSLSKFAPDRLYEEYAVYSDYSDSWSLLEDHLLHTAGMAMAVVCRRKASPMVVLRLHTTRGLVCFSRRLKYGGGKYSVWTQQCAKDLTINVKMTIANHNTSLTVPCDEKFKEINMLKMLDDWWALPCLDNTSANNMRYVACARADHDSGFMCAEGCFRDFVSVAFVSFCEKT